MKEGGRFTESFGLSLLLKRSTDVLKQEACHRGSLPLLGH